MIVYKILFIIALLLNFISGISIMNPSVQYIIPPDIAKVIIPMSDVFIAMLLLDYEFNYRR